jgi:hypothetical protein
MRIPLALAIMFSVGAAFGADACQKQIPHSLSAALTSAFSKFRTPLVTDNLQEDNEYNLKQGGTGCIAVATGDFNGDGKTDYVLGLTERKGPGALIVVALASGRSWQWKVLDEWKSDRIRLYVGTEKAGVYTRTLALDGPIEKGEVEKLVCRNTLPVLGMTESTEVAYCYAGGKWPYVWVSD